jgi:hypothetical protein
MNPDIQNTAAEIKKYFYDFKRQQIGKSYTPADRFRKPEIWNTAAERCVDLKADPFNFVKAAFLYNNVAGGPYPHQMTGQAVVKWYNQFLQASGASGLTLQDVTEKEVKSTIAHALRMLTSQNRKTWKEFLLDNYEVRLDVVPAYVRIFIMSKDEDIKEKYGRLATEELNSNPHLIEVVQRMGYDTAFTERY